MIRGFVSWKYAAVVSFSDVRLPLARTSAPASFACAANRRLTVATATSTRPDQRRDRHVCGHRRRRELGPHVGRADQDLGDVEPDGGRGHDDEVLRPVRHRAGPDRLPQHEQEHGRGEDPVDEHRRRRAPERGHEAPVHERPVAEREARVLCSDVGADQQQSERRPGGPYREAREPWVGARDRRPLHRELHRAEGVRGDVHEHTEEQHRGREVRRDHGGLEAALDDDATEGRLEQHEDHGGERRAHDLPHAPVPAPGDERLDADQHHGDAREEPVAVLDRARGTPAEGSIVRSTSANRDIRGPTRSPARGPPATTRNTVVVVVAIVSFWNRVMCASGRGQA